MNILNSDYNDRTIRLAGICAALFVGFAFIGFIMEVQWEMGKIQGIRPWLFPLMGKYALAGLLWGVVLDTKNLVKL